MSENIFDYKPIQEWNGKVIDFAVSASKNFELTQIVTSSAGAQEATSLVNFDEYDIDTYQEINRIIRSIFSGEDFDISTYEWVAVGDFNIYTEFAAVSSLKTHQNRAIELYSRNGVVYIEQGYDYFYTLRRNQLLPKLEFFLTHDDPFEVAGLDPLHTPTGCYTDHFNLPRLSENSQGSCYSAGGQWLEETFDTPFYALKDIEGPRNFSTQSGTRADGTPFIRVQWYDGALDPRCSSSSYPTQPSCESSYEYIACNNANTGTELLTRKFDNPTNWVPAAINESECITFNANYCYYRYYTTGNWTAWSTSTNSCNSVMNGSLYPDYHWLPKGTVSDKAVKDNVWWPSAHTQSMIQSQLIYEGNSVYNYPAEIGEKPVGTNLIEFDYDFMLDENGNSRGRQTHIFWVGYNLLQNLENHKTLIEENNWISVAMPSHGNVSTNSAPENIFGYTSLDGQTRVSWKSPQYQTYEIDRVHPIPDRYRIYRSNSYYYGITSPTDYTRNIKHLVGEVPHLTLNGNHEFSEFEPALRSEGLENYQNAYYWITAVWDDWGNTNRGLSSFVYPDYFDDDLGYFDSNTGMPAGINTELNWPVADDNGEEWSSEYRGYFKASTSGTYSFSLYSDDSSWLWLGTAGETLNDLIDRKDNNNELIDNSGKHGAITVSESITLVAGEFYPILMYYGNWFVGNNGGFFSTVLSFAPPSEPWRTSGLGFYFVDQNDTSNGTGKQIEGEFSVSDNSYYR